MVAVLRVAPLELLDGNGHGYCDINVSREKSIFSLKRTADETEDCDVPKQACSPHAALRFLLAFLFWPLVASGQCASNSHTGGVP